MEITLIDNTHLLQFFFPQAENNKLALNFSSILMHTNKLLGKVKKTRNVFSSLWKSAQKLSGGFWEGECRIILNLLLFKHRITDALIKEFDGFSQQIETEIKEKKGKNVDYFEYETIVGPYIYYEPVSGDDVLILKGSPEVVVKASIRIGEMEYLMGKDFDYYEKLSLKY